MLSAVPPRITPTCAVVNGTSYAGSCRCASRNARARSRDPRDDVARDLHGVDALRRQRRMRLVAAHAAAPALLALVRDDELHAGRLADDAAGRARRLSRRRRRSAGARRCSRFPRRTTARNAAAARGRGAGTRGTNASPIAEKLFMSVDAAAVQPVARRASPSNGSVSHGWPSTGTTSVWPDSTMPPRRRVAVLRGSVANRFALRRSSSNVSAVVGAEVLEIGAHPFDQLEIRIAADRRECDQPADHVESDEVRRRIGALRDGDGIGGVHRASPRWQCGRIALG